MQITEIRIFPKEGQDKKLQAYATVTFDHCFVVRNIKVIQGTSGLFIAMPSRKMRYVCPRCRSKYETGAKYCSQCGTALGSKPMVAESHEDNRNEHRDIAHPITQEFRDYVQNEVLKTYAEEIKKFVPGSSRPPQFEDE